MGWLDSAPAHDGEPRPAGPEAWNGLWPQSGLLCSRFPTAPRVSPPTIHTMTPTKAIVFGALGSAHSQCPSQRSWDSLPFMVSVYDLHRANWCADFHISLNLGRPGTQSIRFKQLAGSAPVDGREDNKHTGRERTPAIQTLDENPWPVSHLVLNFDFPLCSLSYLGTEDRGLSLTLPSTCLRRRILGLCKCQLHDNCSLLLFSQHHPRSHFW